MTTSIAAPKRKPVTTARERNCAIQPILRTARSRNRRPEASVIPATNEATSCSSVMPAASTALAATAARPELGPHRDLPAGAEDRVEDRAGGRGIQAVLQRDPGDARVPEVLRNDQGRDGDPGDQIAAQPRAVVGAELADEGDPGGPLPVRLGHAPFILQVPTFRQSPAGPRNAPGKRRFGPRWRSSGRRVRSRRASWDPGTAARERGRAWGGCRRRPRRGPGRPLPTG